MIEVEPEVRAWAARRLQALAQRFDLTFANADELRRGGVGEAHIRSLYPFDAASWTHGELDLTLPAGALLPPSRERSAAQQAFLRLRAEFATPREIFYSLSVQEAQLSAEMSRAAIDSSHEDDAQSFPAALHLTILLLHALAEREEVCISEGLNSKDPTDTRWKMHYPSYRLLVDDLVRLLPAC